MSRSILYMKINNEEVPVGGMLCEQTNIPDLDSLEERVFSLQGKSNKKRTWLEKYFDVMFNTVVDCFLREDTRLTAGKFILKDWIVEDKYRHCEVNFTIQSTGEVLEVELT